MARIGPIAHNSVGEGRERLGSGQVRNEMGEKVINIETFADGHRPRDLVVPEML